MKRILLIGTAVALATVAPAHAQNIVKNGSFENGANGLDNWTLGGAINAGGAGASNPVVITYNNPAPYPDGAYGEAIPTDTASSGSPDAIGNHLLYLSQDSGAQTLSQNIMLDANKMYTIGFDYYVPQNGYNNPFDATLSFMVGNTTIATLTTGSPSSNTPPVTWFNFAQTFNSAGGGMGTLVFTYNANGYTAADFGVDRVFLVSGVPEAGTWAMMIAGFGMVGGAMRRRSTARLATA